MHYDLIIVGGGLVGASLACALHTSHLKIAVIEAKLPHHDDPRLFGLTASSCQFLKDLEIWPSLSEFATPISRVHVSYQGSFGAVRLNHSDVGLLQLGHVIPAFHIELALYNKLIQNDRISYYCPATVEVLQDLNHSGELNLKTVILKTNEGEKRVHSTVVIAADGVESTIRKQLTIEADVVDYQQSAIVTQTFLKRFHDYTAYERLNSKGAISMLPLLGNQCATIWTADHSTISHLMMLSDESFITLLQKEFGYRLGKLEKITKRFVFPLKTLQAKEKLKQGVLLLGNAAHTLHPIAAQGFNLALYEVKILSEVIKNKLTKSEALTSADLEKTIQYSHRQRSFSQLVSHQLAQLSQYHSPLLNMCLPLGMVGLDNLKPIKAIFINRMIGRATPVMFE